MAIRCRECVATNLPHDEHCTPAELAELRRLVAEDNARSAALRKPPAPRKPATYWISPATYAVSDVVHLPDEDVTYG